MFVNLCCWIWEKHFFFILLLFFRVSLCVCVYWFWCIYFFLRYTLLVMCVQVRVVREIICIFKKNGVRWDTLFISPKKNRGVLRRIYRKKSTQRTRKNVRRVWGYVRDYSHPPSVCVFFSCAVFFIRNKKNLIFSYSQQQTAATVVWENFVNEKAALLLLLMLSPIKKLWCCIYIYILCLVNRITQYTQFFFFRGGFLCDIRV